MSSRLTVSHITRFVRRQKLVLAGLILVMCAGAVSLYTKPANEGNPQRSENARLQANGRAAPPLAKFITHAAAKALPVLNVQKQMARRPRLARFMTRRAVWCWSIIGRLGAPRAAKKCPSSTLWRRVIKIAAYG